jgi:hypothetical protein
VRSIDGSVAGKVSVVRERYSAHTRAS